ncbi:hypothetical protein D3C87_1427760 [compost metagenome]
MASNSLICANDNDFNRYILGNDAIYFKDADDVVNHLLRTNYNDVSFQSMLSENRKKIENIYDWEIIVDQYMKHFNDIFKIKKYQFI